MRGTSHASPRTGLFHKTAVSNPHNRNGNAERERESRLPGTAHKT